MDPAFLRFIKMKRIRLDETKDFAQRQAGYGDNLVRRQPGDLRVALSALRQQWLHPGQPVARSFQLFECDYGSPAKEHFDLRKLEILIFVKKAFILGLPSKSFKSVLNYFLKSP